ncbi:MAG: metalloregulator ArsR/SmtB family transcription factor [Acidimicrobiia bacterium]|jgi:DNA-binding transcriptional ArsR family regulator
MSAAADPFAALGDVNRRAIIMELAGGERSVQEIANGMAISRPAVSRHLRLLSEAGLVTARPEGVRRLYRLEDAGAAQVRWFMEQVWGEATARFRLAVENTQPA